MGLDIFTKETKVRAQIGLQRSGRSDAAHERGGERGLPRMYVIFAHVVVAEQYVLIAPSWFYCPELIRRKTYDQTGKQLPRSLVQVQPEKFKKTGKKKGKNPLSLINNKFLGEQLNLNIFVAGLGRLAKVQSNFVMYE